MPDPENPTDPDAFWSDRAPGPGLVDNLRGMAYQCRNDEHWTMEFVSRGAEGLTGYAPADLVRNARISFQEIIHPDDREPVRATVNAALAHDGPFEIEYRIQAANGEVKWVRERGHPVYDAERRLLGLEGFIVDITARKAEEEHLQRVRDELQAVHLAAPVPVFLMDTEGRVRSWNPAAERTFGWTADEVVGKRLPIVQDDRLDEFAAVRRRVVAGEVLAGEETECRRKDGTEVPVQIFAAPLRDAGDRVVGIVGIVVDNSERVARERELLALNRALRVLGASNQMIIRCTDEAEILDEACRIAVEDGGYRLARITYPDGDAGPRTVARRGAEAADAILEAMGDAGPVHEAIRDRQLRLFRDLSSDPGAGPWRDELLRAGIRGWAALPLVADGDCFGALTVCTGEADAVDPAELEILQELAGDLAYGIRSLRSRRREEQLEDRLRRAEKLEAIGQLAGGIAHDFNNSLTVIRSLAELLLEDPGLDADRKRDIAEMKKAAEQSAGLTRQLLAFSRRQAVERQVVDLTATVTEKKPMLAPLLGEHISVELALEEDLHPVLIDPVQAEQVFINLAVNARDAMPGGGTLTVETANVEVPADVPDTARPVLETLEPGAYVRFAVSDDGTGMDAETLDRIFDPFFTTKPGGKGTGLGLATVQGIVEQNGGRIFVDSEPGAGTRFSIYLPRSRAEPRPGRRPEPASATTGTETVLVVEDEDGVRGVVSRILKKHGYTVLEAADGAAALELARGDDEIHVVLTDLVLPDMNGRALAETLREARPEARVIFMSGYDPDELGSEVRAALDATFIPKPFEQAELVRKLRTVLDGEAGGA